jgi:hypothetical protein
VVEVGDAKACAVYLVAPLTALQLTTALKVAAVTVTLDGALAGAPCATTPAAFTTIVTAEVAVCAPAVAVTVYVADGVVDVGVPDITPVDESILKPVGSVAVNTGVVEKFAGTSVAVAEIGVPTTAVMLCVVGVRAGVGAAFTTIVTAEVAVCAPAVAVTVYVADGVAVVGVPEITPVDELTLKPSGSVAVNTGVVEKFAGTSVAVAEIGVPTTAVMLCVFGVRAGGIVGRTTVVATLIVVGAVIV